MRIEEVIGKRIAAARHAAGWSQTWLGTLLEGPFGRVWTPQQVSNAETGKRAFTAAELIGFAYALEVPIVELLTPPASVEDIDLPSGAAISARELHPTPGAAPAILEALRGLEKDRAHRARLERREQRTLARLIALVGDEAVPVDDDQDDEEQG